MKTIYVDIDETICFTPSNRDYSKSVALSDRIELVNRLYDTGDRIIYWTSRGSLTGIPYYLLTYKQLTGWGCKFHHLIMGKPYYDLLIDDRTMRPEEFEKL